MAHSHMLQELLSSLCGTQAVDILNLLLTSSSLATVLPHLEAGNTYTVAEGPP